MPQLILASTSPYRRQLLERLGLEFETASPRVDESRRPGEAPRELALRLAQAKASAVAASHPEALVIGCDQVAVLEGEVLGKPGSHENAVRQLQKASGRCVSFLTGLCLLDGSSRDGSSGATQLALVPYSVYFRRLTDAQIEHYLRREQPYDCAGSFKSEGLGIALFERMEGDDPSALVGLPLIRLVHMLETAGMPVI
jgi:7-methyl-GTP pyrophosphatase